MACSTREMLADEIVPSNHVAQSTVQMISVEMQASRDGNVASCYATNQMFSHKVASPDEVIITK
jgi:hypothetical protein